MGKNNQKKLSLSKNDYSDYEEQGSRNNYNDNKGKPINGPFENQIMSRLRKGKIQEIRAESSVQILCHELRDDHPENYAGRTLKGSEDSFAKQKLTIIQNWFIEKDQNKFEPLWMSFLDGVAQWRYKQFKNQDDIPQFLFKDQADLTYLLWFSLSNSKIQSLKTKTEYSNEELFFQQLLSLAAQDQLSFKVIEEIKIHYNQIIGSMEGLKDKIIEKWKNEQKEQSKQQKNQQDIENDEESSPKKAIMKNTQYLEPEVFIQSNGITDEIRKGCLSVHVPTQTQSKDILKRIKTKQIHRQQPGSSNKSKDKGRGRPKKATPQIQQSPIDTQNLSKLVQAMLSHIAFAYKYVYPYELRKKQLISQ